MPRPDHIPLELLQTFACLVDLDGDATSAAQVLDVSQPTISKRLSALRKLTTDAEGQPWLLLKGKRWKLTDEGQRVRGVVADLVQRYGLMEHFIAERKSAKQTVSIACGQQAATGFVKEAVERFLREHPDCRVRLSTPRGTARIEGVAGGQFDLAIVTDSPATIYRVARMELYIETLFEDRFVLVANPPSKATWADQWNALPTRRPANAKELLGLPFILPEPNASRRQQFDNWFHGATGKLPEVVLETGGWQALAGFAASGIGVGVIPQSSTETPGSQKRGNLSVKQLDTDNLFSDEVRLIARKAHGVDSADFLPAANDLANRLRNTFGS